MKTINCENPGCFVMCDTEKPSLRKGHAIIHIKRVCICGTDLHAYRGKQPFFSYPRILGHELSGVIEEMGENYKGLKKRDKVTIIPYLHCGFCHTCHSGKTNCCTQLKVLGVHTYGGLREYISVPVTHLIECNDLPLDQAAIVECLSIGAHAVRRAELESAERVAHGGRLIYVGLVKSDITFDDPSFHSKELTLLSSRNATKGDFETVIGSLRKGQVDTDSFITHRSAFTKMTNEFEGWLNRENGVIKAIVEWK